MKNKIIILQVCDKESCDNKQTPVAKMGPKSYIYCCDKGMRKSLDDFAKWIGDNKDIVYRNSNLN